MIDKSRIFSFLLAVVMLISVVGLGTQSAQAEKMVTATQEPSEVDLQLDLIYSQIDKLVQKESQNTWYYSVTDLDHDGNLEFIAASLHPQDRSTNLKMWEVSADHSALTVCGLKKDEDESFPDIMTDMSDTFHDTQTDTWNYLFYDNIVISDTEVYTIKTAVNLKDGSVSYEPFAIEHVVLNDAYRNVSHTDINGFPISAEQYNAAGANTFATAERSNTAFEWLTAEEAVSDVKLADSFAVFTGDKDPTEAFPVPKPAALQHAEKTPTPEPAATSAPAATPAPVQPVPVQPVQPTFLIITKNPTNENRKLGDTALFVACSNVYESLSWTFVSPNGGEYSPQSFVSGSSAYVSGEYSTTISVANVESWMNGWGAYCTFYYQGQTARTSTAYIYIKNADQKPAPAPQQSYGSMSGRAYQETERLLTVFLQNGDTIHLPTGGGVCTCNIYGGSVNDIGYAGGGASCVVYYINSPTVDNIYQLDVFIEQQTVVFEPNYNGGWAGSQYYANEPIMVFVPDYGG